MKNIFYVCIFILTITAVSYAGKPAGSGNVPDIPVTSDLADQDSGGMFYSVQSDGFGVYNHGANGTVSVLMANGYNRMAHGDWLLAVGTNRTVAITLDASNAVDSSATLLGTRNLASLQNPCTRSGGNMLTMQQDDAMTCPMMINLLPIGATSNYYQLNMKFWNAPGTDEVLIVCNSVDTVGKCNDWFIDPIPVGWPGTITGPGKTRARLEYVAFKGKSVNSVTPKGDFYLTFHIHVTRP